MTDMQYVEVPIGALDTSVDPAVAPPGTLTIADNASADTPGIYEKRRGYSALAATTTTPIMRLAARGNELLALTRSALYCHEGPTVDNWRSPIQQTAGAISSSRLPSAQVSQASVYLDQTTDVTIGSRATSLTTHVTVHAHQSTVSFGPGPLTIRCIDASGNIVATKAITLGGALPSVVHCVAAGIYVLVLASTTGGSLYYVRVDTSALTFGAATIYQAVSPGVPYFDVTPVSATSCLIAWNSATPNVQVALFNISTLTTTAGPTVQSADVLDGGLSVASDGGTFGMVLYGSTAGGGVRGACFNAATTANTVAAFVIAAVSPVNAGLVYSAAAVKMYCVWDTAAAGTTKQAIRGALVTSAGAVSLFSSSLFNLALASKPAIDPTAADTFFPILLNVWAPHSLQQTYFTIRSHVDAPTSAISIMSPLATHAYRAAYRSAIVRGQLTDVDAVSSTVIAFSASISYKFLSTNAPRAGWSTFVLDLGAATMMGHVQALGSTYIAGGHAATYDGITIRETNFLMYPDITVATPGAVGAGGMDDGAYSYIAIFEGSDANGNTDRSTTSLAVSATTSAGAGLGKVTLTIDLGPTRLGQNVNVLPVGNVSMFRTTAAGTTYFFIGTASISGIAANVTYADQANDSTITSNRILYTAGGVLDREPPPTAMQFLIHRNRLWGISAADRKVLFYSGELSPGESPWFSGVQQLRVDSGGDITAIATMDDKLIVYKSDRVFKVYGSGANALGQNSDLSAPTPMNTDAGALDARATVAMHAGTMYRNKKGIQLFSRGEESGYIGAPVESYLDATGSVIASTLLTTAREVRFELDTGKKAVYNYGTQRWTTHSNYLGASAVDAICVGDTYYWATSTGVVYKESTSSYLDPASTFAPMTIEFAWIAPAGRQGLVRARRVIALADRRDPHDLTVTSSVNYGTFEAPIVSALTNAVIAAWPREQVRVTLLSQKVESIKVKLVDAVSSGGGATVTGQGYALRGLAFLAGVMKGAFDKQFVAAARV